MEQGQLGPRSIFNLQLSTHAWVRSRFSAEDRPQGVHFVSARKWQVYDVWQAYERAREKHDPLLAPHGFFRALKPGDARHALEFFNAFGPLLHLSFGASQSRLRPPFGRMPFKAEYFWTSHARFCLIARLWESRDKQAALKPAWRAIAENHAQASRFAEPLLEVAFDRFPWTLSQCDFGAWEKRATFADMRRAAVALVLKELNAHTEKCGIVWSLWRSRAGEAFSPALRHPSLLSMIWEFFALDVKGGYWRQCPHCGRLFYPGRKDQFYCTSRQQVLASKREYARRRRAEERRRKLQRKNREGHQ